MKNSNKLIILTGPSGVGKGTVVKEILVSDGQPVEFGQALIILE